MNFASKPAFLLGAGASIPGGYSSTTELTQRILSGANVGRHTDGMFYVGFEQTEAFPYPYVAVATKFLELVRKKIDASIQEYRGGDTNYEDLFYVLRQIADFEAGEIENPIVRPFLDSLLADIEKIRSPLSDRIASPGQLAEETGNYVRDVVWRLLDHPPTRLTHLEALVAPIQKAGGQAVVATLNHDNHFETYLRVLGLNVLDGFGPVLNEVRYWDAEFASLQGKATAIFKLHGSVDWFQFRPDQGTLYDDRTGISMNNDYEHTKAYDGRNQHLLSPRPIMIMGTFNKYIDYSSSIFAPMHTQWRSALGSVDRLVICGYGFGDKGINAQVIEWMYGKRDRKILVINPDIDALRKRARGAIKNKWDEWAQQGNIESEDSTLEKLNSDRIMKFFIT